MNAIDWLNRLLGERLCYLYLVAVAITAYEVMMRYLFNAPTTWAFELTILFGGLLTALGLFAVGRLPNLRSGPGYSARFSAEDFGLVVGCRERDVAEVDALLRAHHAKEVNLVEA